MLSLYEAHVFSVHEIIDIAVQLEKNGENIYRNAGEITDNFSLMNLLEWIADEERNHAQWLTELKSDIDLEEDHHLIAEISQTLVSDFVGKQAFSLDDVDFSQIENTNDLIEIFIDFEMDTIVFYEMLKSFITDEKAAEKIDQIIAEEKSHIEKFQELLPDASDGNDGVGAET